MIWNSMLQNINIYLFQVGCFEITKSNPFLFLNKFLKRALLNLLNIILV